MTNLARSLRFAATVLPSLWLTLAPVPAAAQLAVIDTANYSQNLLQAARALEQINNQVKSLQNEATMLQDMATNLKRINFPELSKLSGDLSQIGGLMDQAKTINFKVGEVEADFRETFPGLADTKLKSDQRFADARARLESALESFRHSMVVQAGVVASVKADSGILSDLVSRSQGAAGALQVEQATNQILALSTKQQMQLQDLLAAEFRSQAIERARQVQSEAEAREATTRFLGSGRAYPSTRE